MFKGATNSLVRFDTPFSFVQNYRDSDYVNLRDDELTGNVLLIDLDKFTANHSTMTTEITHLKAI